MPKQVSGLITWYTDVASRAGRGRSYIPFPSAADTDGNGAPSTDYLIALGNLSDDLAAYMTYPAGDSDISMSLVVLSAGLGDQPVTSYTRRDRFATQRRRGDYGQPNLPGL